MNKAFVSIFRTKKMGEWIYKQDMQSSLNCCIFFKVFKSPALLANQLTLNGRTRTGTAVKSQQAHCDFIRATIYVFPRFSPSLTLMTELQCDWTVPVDPSELVPRRGLVTALRSGRQTKPSETRPRTRSHFAMKYRGVRTKMTSLYYSLIVSVSHSPLYKPKVNKSLHVLSESISVEYSMMNFSDVCTSMLDLVLLF